MESDNFDSQSLQMVISYGIHFDTMSSKMLASIQFNGYFFTYTVKIEYIIIYTELSSESQAVNLFVLKTPPKNRFCRSTVIS